MQLKAIFTLKGLVGNHHTGIHTWECLCICVHIYACTIVIFGAKIVCKWHVPKVCS